jgi:ribosomal protein S18 acetylase RimI-like enzyme
MQQTIKYEEYFPAARREEANLKQNKQIHALAKKHKFYPIQIGNILNIRQATFSFGGGGPVRFMHIAKKYTAKGSKVVGFIIFGSDTLWARGCARMLTTLHYWFVAPEFQGKGVGKELYQKMMETSVSYGVANQAVEFDGRDQRLCDTYTRLGYTAPPPNFKYDGYEMCAFASTPHVAWFNIQVKKIVGFGGELTLVEEEPTQDSVVAD